MSELLTIKDVCYKLKVTKTTVYKWLHEDPTFPKQITLGPRVVRWKADELEQWLQNRVHG
jgi:prophage regulatory protein